MRFDILSLFPSYFQGPFDVSILKRARQKGLLDLRLIDIRDFAHDRHRKVDDRPWGGGPGMLMLPGPIAEAIRSVKQEGSRVVYLSPQGKKLNAAKCRELAQCQHLIILCGHYEGVDERVLEVEVDEEISIGDYVLTSGCPAAAVLVDAIARFIPGVVGNEEGVSQDSFEEGIFDAPQFTGPDEFEGRSIPPILKSGHHAKIASWRKQQAYEKTCMIRPDLVDNLQNGDNYDSMQRDPGA